MNFLQRPLKLKQLTKVVGFILFAEEKYPPGRQRSWYELSKTNDIKASLKLSRTAS